MMLGLRKMNRVAMAAWVLLAAPALLADEAKPVIPAGTRIDVVLTSTLSSSTSQAGDPFEASIQDPIFSGGEEIIPTGSTLRGHVTFVQPAGRVKGKGEMRLVGDSIVTKSGREFTFKAEITNSASSDVKVKDNEGTLEGKGKGVKKTAKDAGVGAALGAGAGTLTVGAGTGTLYGAGVGAAVGALSNLLKHNKGVVLPVGTDLTFVLTSPATEGKATPAKNGPPSFVCPTCN
jgi:hypothetical protein